MPEEESNRQRLLGRRQPEKFRDPVSFLQDTVGTIPPPRNNRGGMALGNLLSSLQSVGIGTKEDLALSILPGAIPTKLMKLGGRMGINMLTQIPDRVQSQFITAMTKDLQKADDLLALGKKANPDEWAKLITRMERRIDDTRDILKLSPAEELVYPKRYPGLKIPDGGGFSDDVLETTVKRIDDLRDTWITHKNARRNAKRILAGG